MYTCVVRTSSKCREQQREKHADLEADLFLCLLLQLTEVVDEYSVTPTEPCSTPPPSSGCSSPHPMPLFSNPREWLPRLQSCLLNLGFQVECQRLTSISTLSSTRPHSSFIPQINVFLLVLSMPQRRESPRSLSSMSLLLQVLFQDQVDGLPSSPLLQPKALLSRRASLTLKMRS